MVEVFGIRFIPHLSINKDGTKLLMLPTIALLFSLSQIFIPGKYFETYSELVKAAILILPKELIDLQFNNGVIFFSVGHSNRIYINQNLMQYVFQVSTFCDDDCNEPYYESDV